MKDNQIYVTYSKDIRKMTRDLMERSGITEDLPDRSARIGIKPNLVVAVTPDSGATTHMEIVTEIIEYLQDEGYENLLIIESSWVGDSTKRAFRVNGYDKLSRRYEVPLLDVKDDDYVRVSAGGMTMEVSETALNLDYLISLPVLKGHCQTYMTCALKNQKGLLSDSSKRLFHTKGLMLPIAALNKVIKPSLVVVDSICGDLDFEEGGNPVETNRMLMAKDPVLLDTYAGTLLGFTPDEVTYIRYAEELGVGSADLSKAEIIELEKPSTALKANPTGQARTLARYTNEDNACSACFANLIHALKRLDQEYMLSVLTGKKVCIGQGFRGEEMEIGVGACCIGAKHSVKGCPPSATDILEMLKEL